MRGDPTLNSERRNENRRVQTKIHELIELLAFSDSTNHRRFVINPNISQAIDTAIRQLNIFKKQTEDGGERSIKIVQSKFHIIQFTQSTCHTKSNPNENELIVQTAGIEEKIDNEDRLTSNQKYSMKQTKLRQVRLAAAKQAAYNAKNNKPGKSEQFYIEI